MTYYLKNGNNFSVTPDDAVDLYKALPAGSYTIKQDRFEEFYLETVDSFEIKGKIYGDTVKQADRILRTFNDRPNTTGILLAGEKGSGKTLLAKLLTNGAAEQGIPTIIINQAWHGDKFNTFIQAIEQPCVILFDEFEKVYDREQQEAVLTLLDGVFPSKKLFVLTCNDKYRIDSHMRNRPGRIYYLLDFEGLEESFINEYCNENLKDQSKTNEICRLGSLFGQFNFDMLKAIVEEINRYGEEPRDVLKMLNAKPEFEEGSEFSVSVAVNGTVVEPRKTDTQTWKGNPLTNDRIRIYYYYGVDKDGDEEWIHSTFEVGDLEEINPKNGTFVYVNKQNDRLVLTRKSKFKFNIDAF